MIHDTKKERVEFVKWLKKNGLYNGFDSNHTMRKMHLVYYTLKDNKESN